MSRIEVHLRDVSSTARAGQTVSGTVRVGLGRTEEVAVWVVPRITVSYSGELKGSATRRGLMVHQGPLDAGTHEMDFEFSCPTQPASYAGEAVHVGWEVEAQVKTAGQESRAKVPLSIAADPESKLKVSPLDAFGAHSDLEHDGWSLGCVVISLVVTLALAGGAVAGWRADSPDVWMTLAIFGVGSALLFVGMVRNYRAGALVGTPTLAAEPVVVAPGESGALGVSLTHLEGAPVEDVEVRLEVFECGRYESQRPFREYPIASRESSLRRTGDGEWSGSVALPEPGSVPPTYLINNEAQIRWVLRAQLSGEKLPDGEARTTLWLEAAPVD